ncbi:hypothetical protein PAI11_29240 [Patulibacter medicamentivorans]|jgi:transposase|uniref:Uncharacterized protein n=1 Tax=Patulibacter medicamentivorans TaxID=1097667 RepID=H0E7W7_9ACTN|nr:hypothetical protein [Patulibacter medicamentivorans]EHN10225.1 hypothetical protein PAI11_29240 [Patulibacter medicamentivorans]
MYHLSRALYRDVTRNLPNGGCHASQERVLRACETTIERLVTDPHYFAHPARALFYEIRFLFPMRAQAQVWRIVQHYIGTVAGELERRPDLGHELTGTKPCCQATTRRGAACQRDPLPGSRYCPSHQHLAETEETIEDLREQVPVGAVLAA